MQQGSVLKTLLQRTSKPFQDKYAEQISSAWDTYRHHQPDDDSVSGLWQDLARSREAEWTCLQNTKLAEVATRSDEPRWPYVTYGVLGLWCLSVQGVYSAHEVYELAFKIACARTAFVPIGMAIRGCGMSSVKKQAALAGDWARLWRAHEALKCLSTEHVHALCAISDKVYEKLQLEE